MRRFLSHDVPKLNNTNDHGAAQRQVLMRAARAVGPREAPNAFSVALSGSPLSSVLKSLLPTAQDNRGVRIHKPIPGVLNTATA